MENYYDSVGEELVRKYGTRNPFEIAERLGIHISYIKTSTLKGAYKVIANNRWIFINEDLPDEVKAIVCAHEIGHDRLHRDAAKNGLAEFSLYNMTDRREYEANIVASQILLDDDEVLDYIYNYGYDAEQIARIMHTDVNLIALKIAHLNRTGHKLRGQDYSGNFLK